VRCCQFVPVLALRYSGLFTKKEEKRRRRDSFPIGENPLTLIDGMNANAVPPIPPASLSSFPHLLFKIVSY
jgi:hypothetical protein